MKFRTYRRTRSTRWQCRCSIPRVWDRRPPSWWWPTKEVSGRVALSTLLRGRMQCKFPRSRTISMMHAAQWPRWGIRHVRHANDGHKSISRSPQLFFTYLGPAKFQILRLIDMPDKWPIRPRKCQKKWGGYMVCISHIKCSTRCRCSSFRNKFAFVCTFSFSVPCNISMVSQMRVEEGKAKQQLWDSLNHKMPLPCNEANK